MYSMHHEGYFSYGEDTYTSHESASYSFFGVVYEVDSTSKLAEPHLQGSVNMMHAVASYLRRDIEAVITRRS